MERVIKETIEFHLESRAKKLVLDSQCEIQGTRFTTSISQTKLNNVDHISVITKCNRLYKDANDSLSFYLNFFTDDSEDFDELWVLKSSTKHKVPKGCFGASFIVYIPQKTIFNKFVKKFCRLNIEKVVYAGDEKVGEVNMPIKEEGSLKNSYLEKLWNDKLFTDFKFIVNGQEFSVHKSILAAQNEVMKTMFDKDHNMRENVTNTAVIRDTSAETFKQFLEYLYIRKYPKTSSHMIDLYKTAHKYDVKDLMKYCQKIIQENIDVKNAMEMLEFGNIFEVESVRKSAFSIIQKEMFPEKKLLPNLERNPKVMREIINAKNTYELKFSSLTTLAK